MLESVWNNAVKKIEEYFYSLRQNSFYRIDSSASHIKEDNEGD